jgi:nitrate/nitrite-specific signal transduction histidine kinase
MKERANLSGGDYEMTSVAGQGTRIRVSWQIDNAVESQPYQPTSA